MLKPSELSHYSAKNASPEHFAPPQGSELTDLARQYGHSLYISGLGLVEPLNIETQALTNLLASVNDRLDQLTAIVK